MSIETKIAEFIRVNVSGQRREQIGADDNLIEEALIDSLGIINLIEYVREEFGIEIADNDVEPENFVSVRAIAAMIDAKKA